VKTLRRLSALFGHADARAGIELLFVPAIHLACTIAHGLRACRARLCSAEKAIQKKKFAGSLFSCLRPCGVLPWVGRAIDRPITGFCVHPGALQSCLGGRARPAGWWRRILSPWLSPWAALASVSRWALYDPLCAPYTPGFMAPPRCVPITRIHLYLWFCDTCRWPLSAFLDSQFGWRVGVPYLEASLAYCNRALPR